MDISGGMREVSISGHFSEEDCFPAKGPKENLQLADATLKENRPGPIPVDDPNIKPRNEAKLKATTPCVAFPTVTDEFNDLRKKATPSGICGVQEENFGNCEIYKSKYVVSGSPLELESLLNTAVFPCGVLTDSSLKASSSGTYEEGREFEVVKKLGKGGYGEVDLCRHRGGKVYVRKQITGQFNRNEVKMLMSLQHDHITGLFGYIRRNSTHEILMEYGGLSLKVFIETQNWREMLSPNVVMQLAMQGFSALDYMHGFRKLHLDIKPQNVCIAYNSDLNLIIKLTDFGTSNTQGQAIGLAGLTPEYMSPEACQSVLVLKKPEFHNIFKNFELTGKTDVFSWGLTLYFMLEGSHAVLDIWKSQLTPEPFAGFRLNFIVHLAHFPQFICDYIIQKQKPETINRLLSMTLTGDQQKRVTAETAWQFVKQNIEAEQVEFPSTSQPSSPMSVDMTDNSSTMEDRLSQKSPPVDQCPRQGMKPVGDKVQQVEFPSTSQPSSPMSVDMTENSFTMEDRLSQKSPPGDQCPRQGMKPEYIPA